MLPLFPLCRIHLAEKRIAVVSELLPGKSQMKLRRVQGPGIFGVIDIKRITRRRVTG
jgi:hypothetical protein